MTETCHTAVFYNAHMYGIILHCIVLDSTVLLLLTDEHACNMCIYMQVIHNEIVNTNLMFIGPCIILLVELIEPT